MNTKHALAGRVTSLFWLGKQATGSGNPHHGCLTAAAVDSPTAVSTATNQPRYSRSTVAWLLGVAAAHSWQAAAPSAAVLVAYKNQQMHLHRGRAFILSGRPSKALCCGWAPHLLKSALPSSHVVQPHWA